MPLMPTHTPEPVFDPFWFPLFAEIIIPSFVGLGTIAVAVAAFVASSRSQAMAKRAEENDRRKVQMAARSTFVSFLEGAPKDGALNRRHEEIATGQGAEKLAPWRARQSDRVTAAKISFMNPTTYQHTPAHDLYEETVARRFSDWVQTGRFDDSDIPLEVLANAEADPLAGD